MTEDYKKSPSSLKDSPKTSGTSEYLASPQRLKPQKEKSQEKEKSQDSAYLVSPKRLKPSQEQNYTKSPSKKPPEESKNNYSETPSTIKPQNPATVENDYGVTKAAKNVAISHDVKTVISKGVKFASHRNIIPSTETEKTPKQPEFMRKLSPREEAAKKQEYINTKAWEFISTHSNKKSLAISDFVGFTSYATFNKFEILKEVIAIAKKEKMTISDHKDAFKKALYAKDPDVKDPQMAYEIFSYARESVNKIDLPAIGYQDFQSFISDVKRNFNEEEMAQFLTTRESLTAGRNRSFVHHIISDQRNFEVTFPSILKLPEKDLCELLCQKRLPEQSPSALIMDNYTEEFRKILVQRVEGFSAENKIKVFTKSDIFFDSGKKFEKECVKMLDFLIKGDDKNLQQFLVDCDSYGYNCFFKVIDNYPKQASEIIDRVGKIGFEKESLKSIFNTSAINSVTEKIPEKFDKVVALFDFKKFVQTADSGIKKQPSFVAPTKQKGLFSSLSKSISKSSSSLISKVKKTLGVSKQEKPDKKDSQHHQTLPRSSRNESDVDGKLQKQSASDVQYRDELFSNFLKNSDPDERGRGSAALFAVKSGKSEIVEKLLEINSLNSARELAYGPEASAINFGEKDKETGKNLFTLLVEKCPNLVGKALEQIDRLSDQTKSQIILGDKLQALSSAKKEHLPMIVDVILNIDDVNLSKILTNVKEDSFVKFAFSKCSQEQLDKILTKFEELNKEGHIDKKSIKEVFFSEVSAGRTISDVVDANKELSAKFFSLPFVDKPLSQSKQRGSENSASGRGNLGNLTLEPKRFRKAHPSKADLSKNSPRSSVSNSSAYTVGKDNGGKSI